jgi:hypothetical protein
MPLYKILPQLVLRTPYYSFAGYATKNIENINFDPAFKRALYLASSPFYNLLAAKGFDIVAMSDKEKLSLLKYYNRMSYRPTPFGNFAALTATIWGYDEQIRLTDSKLHIQPDHEIAVTLGEFLNDNLPEEKLFQSPTLYKQGNQFRFTKQDEQGNGTRLNFSLASINADRVNSRIIAFTRTALRSGAVILVN